VWSRAFSCRASNHTAANITLRHENIEYPSPAQRLPRENRGLNWHQLLTQVGTNFYSNPGLARTSDPTQETGGGGDQVRPSEIDQDPNPEPQYHLNSIDLRPLRFDRELCALLSTSLTSYLLARLFAVKSELGTRANLGPEQTWDQSKLGTRANLGPARTWGQSELGTSQNLGPART